jgi:hypothetical protein
VSELLKDKDKEKDKEREKERLERDKSGLLQA